MDEKILQNCLLFTGMPPNRVKAVFSCLAVRTPRFAKGDFLLQTGDTPQNIGLVLSGSVLIVKEDFWGMRTIVGRAVAGELFAESFALAKKPATVSVQAAEETQTAFLSAEKICTGCETHCDLHGLLQQNLVAALAAKNLFLSGRCGQLAGRTIEEKLMHYLSDRAANAKSDSFDIPFDRQQLADYLCCDRSALSARISRLQKQGLLQAQKNRFTLLRAQKGETDL